MLTLYTPATGFPDLEIKIAYGLARVGIESYAIDKVKIIPEKGFYSILIDGKVQSLNTSFNRLLRRILSSDFIPRLTPGITSRSAKDLKIKESEEFDLIKYTKIIEFAEHKESENFCRHKEKTKVSNIIGFTAMATTGVLCKRDGLDITSYQGRPRRPTKPREICKTCGVLALLGMWFSSFIFSIRDKEIITIPIPKQEISGEKLGEIFALQHNFRKDWLPQQIPQTIIPLSILSKIPLSADILKEFDLLITILRRQQGYHVDGLFIMHIGNYILFIEHSAFNVASIDKMLERNAYIALTELNRICYNKDKSTLTKFARLYVQETSTDKFTNLLYPETTMYLLKEVAMISQDVIENPAIVSLSRTLRYFIKEKKYGYADDIRNARKDSKDFEKTIAKMLREGRLRLEQKEKIHIPTNEEIQTVFRLANLDFESTKLALVMLAFSFPSKADDPTQ